MVQCCPVSAVGVEVQSSSEVLLCMKLVKNVKIRINKVEIRLHGFRLGRFEGRDCPEYVLMLPGAVPSLTFSGVVLELAPVLILTGADFKIRPITAFCCNQGRNTRVDVILELKRFILYLLEIVFRNDRNLLLL